MSVPTTNITSVLKETRSFPPSPDFAAAAHVKSLAEYEKLWQRAADNPDGFWTEQAEALHLPRDESIVAGFSQGAGLALGLALQRSARPRPKAALALTPSAAALALAPALSPTFRSTPSPTPNSARSTNPRYASSPVRSARPSGSTKRA